MSKVNYYLQHPKKDLSLIYLSIYATNGRIQLSTGETVQPKYWNVKTKRAITKNYPSADGINAVLDAIKGDFQEQLNILKANKKPLSKDFAAQIIAATRNQTTPEKEATKKPTFWEFLDNFINTIRLYDAKVVKARSMAAYKELSNKLKTFSKEQKIKVDFATIDRFMLDKFTIYLYAQNLNPSTVGKYIAKIKTVLNDAKKQGFEVCENYKDVKKPPKTKNTAIYLTESELMELYLFDLSNDPRLERVRDVFIFQAYTAMRYSDIRAFKTANYDAVSETIRFITIKTNTSVIVPVFPIVKNILEKYNGALPKTISEQKTNDYLKELGEKVGFNSKVSKTIFMNGLPKNIILEKWELITTHTARRTGATNMYKATGNVRMVMQITGHQKETTFWNYVRLSEEDHALNFAKIAKNTGFGQIYDPKEKTKSPLRIVA